jgi:uncharacterized membrane protein HdeD (DUF308 family)
MNDGQQPDAADVLASIGRHWGWIMAFGVLTVVLSVWLLFYGVMEITLAFRLRSLGHRAGTRPVHAV